MIWIFVIIRELCSDILEVACSPPRVHLFIVCAREHAALMLVCFKTRVYAYSIAYNNDSRNTLFR